MKLNAMQTSMLNICALKLTVKHEGTETKFVAIIENDCTHVCSGNCRREGCNCLCGEYHLKNK